MCKKKTHRTHKGQYYLRLEGSMGSHEYCCIIYILRSIIMITGIPLNYCSPHPSPSLPYSPSKTPNHLRPYSLFPLHYFLNAQYAKEKHRVGLFGLILIYELFNYTLSLFWQPHYLSQIYCSLTSQ